jgi:quercetin dioxygenase-like cupin family protein
MDVERWDEERDGPFSEAAMREKLERRGYRLSRYVYPPGTVFPDHTHPVEKLDAVASGRFKLTTADVLEAGDCLRVPAGAIHRAEVVGEEAVVSLDGMRQEG